MARRVITPLIDDLDGKKADRTVEFSLDGTNYTIDLSEANAGKLRKALDPYIAAGTRLRRAAPRRSAVPAGPPRPPRDLAGRKPPDPRVGGGQRPPDFRARPHSAGRDRRLPGGERA